MSDTNNEVNNTAATPTPVVNPTPVSAPVVNAEPVQNVAPVVSSVPQTPQVAETQTPPVPIQVPTPQPAPAVATPAPAQPVQQPVEVAPQVAEQVVQTETQPTTEQANAKKQELIEKAKTMDDDSNLFSGPVETKSTDSISADLAVPDDPNDTNTKKETSNQSSGKDEFVDEKENKKLPIAVLIIFVIVLLVVVIYYFIVMTPTKVFDKAIDNIFDTATGAVDSIRNNKSDTIRLNLGADMETDGDINEYLDGILFKANIDADMKKLELALSIISESGKTNIAAEDNFDSKVYIKDGGIYVSNERLEKTYPGRVALYSDSDLTNLNYNRIDDVIDIIERTKNEIVDIIENDQLIRTIAIKRVNKQTTIALKANCTLNNKDIEAIYKPIFKKYLNDKEFIKKVANAVGSSEEEVKDEIQRLYDRDVVTENITVNLYMNLANTQLISLDVTVDDYYVQIDNLNGYFYGLVKYKGVKENFDEPEFKIQFEYDANKGLLNGTGMIDKPGQAFIYSDFDYTRVENKEGKKVGNILNINFFNKVVTGAERDNKKNIIAKLACTLDIEDDNPKITVLGKDKVVETNEEVSKGINESMHRLTHYADYVFRTLLYSLWDDEKYAYEMNKRAVENKIEKAIDKGETPITINDIKTEVEEAKSYCSKTGTYAYRYNGASKTTGEFDGFPEIDDSIFDWICLYGRLSAEEEKDLNFEYSDDIDFDDYEKIIKNKLDELKVKKQKQDIEIEKITVTPETKELKVGEKYRILNAYEPANATKTKISWKSSNNKVATVDSNGEVTARNAGTTEITAKSENGVTATSKITVVAAEEKSE